MAGYGGQERFRNRIDAGRRLAALLGEYAGRQDVIVLGLPRGGVPVAAEVARALGALLDVFLVRKLGVPGQPELAFGAIATGGVRILNRNVISAIGISEREIEEVAGRERAELARREQAYRGDRPPPDLHSACVILVDDGLATGASMRAAVAAVRQQVPARIVVAVPVAAPESRDEFRALVDEVVCVATPQPFAAVGLWYEDFRATTDEEVQQLLRMGRSTADRPRDQEHTETDTGATREQSNAQGRA